MFRDHIPVLLHEVVEGLDPQSSDVVFDATAGSGGHARALAEAAPGITLIECDADADAIGRVKEHLVGARCVLYTAVENFRNLDRVLDGLGMVHVTKVLFDLGFSSVQIDAGGRGLSFRSDEPLLMTYVKEPSDDVLTARTILNEWSEESIADILYGFGEERFARRIARAIAGFRQQGPITHTAQLVAIVENAVPLFYRHGRIHPATRTFQALRIAVNDEYGALVEGLEKALVRLALSGRIAVITFHSGEDRIVKRRFRDWQVAAKGIVLTKRPITPSREEMVANPRARSAKLRIFQKSIS